jgi:hypothetical protein
VPIRASAGRPGRCPEDVVEAVDGGGRGDSLRSQPMGALSPMPTQATISSSGRASMLLGLPPLVCGRGRGCAVTARMVSAAAPLLRLTLASGVPCRSVTVSAADGGVAGDSRRCSVMRTVAGCDVWFEHGGQVPGQFVGMGAFQSFDVVWPVRSRYRRRRRLSTG